MARTLLVVDGASPVVVTRLAVARLVARLRDAVCPMTIGYAQHVNLESLDEARRAGFDQVLTRGQFNQQVSAIIAEAK